MKSSLQQYLNNIIQHSKGIKFILEHHGVAGALASKSNHSLATKIPPAKNAQLLTKLLDDNYNFQLEMSKI